MDPIYVYSYQHGPSCRVCDMFLAVTSTTTPRKTGVHLKREVRESSESWKRYNLQFLLIWTLAKGLTRLRVSIQQAATGFSLHCMGQDFFQANCIHATLAQDFLQASCCTSCPQVSALFCVTFSTELFQKSAGQACKATSDVLQQGCEVHVLCPGL